MESLLEWWNFIFLLPLATGLILGVAIALSGAGADGGETGSGEFGDGDTDHPDLATESEVPAGQTPSVLSQLLSFFGLRRGVPLSVLLPVLLVTGGMTGLLINSILYPLIRSGLLVAIISSAFSLLISGFIGQSIARTLSRFLSHKQPASFKGGLVGLVGKSVYPISEVGGVIHVKDQAGSIHRVTARSYDSAIGAGQSVLLIEYDAQSKSYLVEPYALLESEDTV
jgi:hypothetical protein